jgi:tetratricopeptide (TPR) repeat protein
VEFVVEGSIARSGERVRLNAQVVRAEPETTLWSDSFERATEEVLALENAFAAAVADAIHVQLSPIEEKRMETTHSVDPTAYEAYLQGRYWAGKHGAESLRKAQGYFERAIAIDSTFAPAWSDLAASLLRQGLFFADQEQKLAQAETAVRRALSLDPDSGAAHAALGDLHLARWQWKDGESEILRAIELQPGSAAAHLAYWRLLMRLRRFDESLREIELARSLDPVSANIVANYGAQMQFMERYEEAIAACRQALEIDPDFALAHSYAWFSYHQLGRDPERGKALRAWLATEDFGELASELDSHLASDGYSATLSWLANSLDRMRDDPRADVGFVASLLAQAGELDKAMEWLERGYERREWVMGWIAAQQDLAPLRGRPDFRALVRRVGLPEPPN